MSRISVIKRVLWPAGGSLFAVVGGAAGVVGDLTSFFSELFTPKNLMLPLAGIAVVLGWHCLKRVLHVDTVNESAVAEVVNCKVCDVFRVGLFATVTLLLLVLVGKGQTATETVGRELGLIEDIRDDVGVIRSDVGVIYDTVQPMMIIDKPRTAADHYSNAWVYANIRRDSANAWTSIQQLYSKYTPRKMDAAELYYKAGINMLGETELLSRMREMGFARQDATLLVIAARQSADRTEAQALMAEARRMDPDLPFAHWDMLQMGISRPDFARKSPAGRLEDRRSEKAAAEKFVELYSRQPASHYFFMPQFHSYHLTTARGMIKTFEMSVAGYEQHAKLQGDPSRGRGDTAPERGAPAR